MITIQTSRRLAGALLLAGLSGLSGLTAIAARADAATTLPAPPFPTLKTAAQIRQACDSGLAAAKKALGLLERRKVDVTWMAAFDDYAALVEDGQGPVDFVQYVHPDKAGRDAAQACSMRWTQFNSGVAQNELLYKALKRAPTPTARERELQRVALGAFEDSGVSLPPAKRQRAKAIIDKLGELDQQFNKNIRDANVQRAYTEAELQGVPEGVWKNARRDADGRILLGVDYPSYGPVLQSAENAEARHRMWEAKVNEGGEANLRLLAEIAQLRREYAGLFGYDNYVDFNLRRRMAGNAQTAWKFLDEVQATVTERERADVADLQAAKAQHLGVPAAQVKIERWDASFYSERLRQARFQVDQEALREYFPAQESLRFAMRIIERLMGVKYTEVPADLWHPEVKAFAVSDAATGKPLANLYVDLFPREGKYNHAAVWPLRGSATRVGRLPAAALVVNFNRKGLTIDEMETLLHELGHAVHNNLSNTYYVQQAGTAVMHDFVEAPSQMLEDWVVNKQVLPLMQEVCPSCKPMPEALVDKVVAAKHFGKGTQYGRQHLYASYDLALHGKEPQDPQALWAKMEGATPLGHVPGSKFVAGFSHIAGGYGAGYYGYLWSLVLAMDLRSPFAASKLDAEVGRRYRERVLAQGGQKPAPELVRDFLGRNPSNAAFFDYLKH